MLSVPLSSGSKPLTFIHFQGHNLPLMFSHFQGQNLPLLLIQNRIFACRAFQRDKSQSVVLNNRKKKTVADPYELIKLRHKGTGG